MMKRGTYRLGVPAGLAAVGFGLGVLASRGLAPAGAPASAQRSASLRLSHLSRIGVRK